MILLQKQIIDSTTGAPLPNVTCTITTAQGKAILRNGVTVTRTTDGEGVVIIPALEGDYIQAKYTGFEPVCFSANYINDTVQMYKKESSIMPIVKLETWAIIGFIIICIASSIYFIYKKIKK